MSWYRDRWGNVCDEPKEMKGKFQTALRRLRKCRKHIEKLQTQIRHYILSDKNLYPLIEDVLCGLCPDLDRDRLHIEPSIEFMLNSFVIIHIRACNDYTKSFIGLLAPEKAKAMPQAIGKILGPTNHTYNVWIHSDNMSWGL